MPDSFGARLRQRREEQQIALATIAEQTKIKQSLLEALERDDVSHWPYGIFRRAFIRAYAEAIGLSPDEVVKEFFEVHPEPPEMLSSPWTEAPGAGAESGRASHGPPSRLRYLVGSAIGSLARRRRATAGEEAYVAARARAPRASPADPDVPAAADVDLAAGSTASSAPPPEHRAESIVDAAFVGAERASAEAAAQLAEPAESALPEEPASPVEPVLPAEPDLDFGAVAHLCTELGRAAKANDVQPLLAEAVRILDATGLIVWVWDASAEQLRPSLVHGYSARVLAQLPTVGRDADNATAAAFRTAQPGAISGRDHTSGALVVPLLTPSGCSGVLAIELHDGRERSVPVRAVATILAAMLAQLVGIRPAEVLSESISASR